MFDLFSGLDFWVAASLVLALLFVLSFEFINGFHDTANSIATVVATKVLSPGAAVSLAAVMNTGRSSRCAALFTGSPVPRYSLGEKARTPATLPLLSAASGKTSADE